MSPRPVVPRAPCVPPTGCNGPFTKSVTCGDALGFKTGTQLLSTFELYDGTGAVRYDGGMSYRWPIMALILALCFAPACKKPTPQQPVVVHIFRDLYSPYAHDLDHRILDYQSSNPRLPSGAPIVVQTIHELDYKTALEGDFEKNVKAEAVILNSSADVANNPALTAAMAKALNICGAVKACPAVVPAFVMPSATGDRATAAQAFLTYLAQTK